MSKKLAQMLKQNTMSNFQGGLEGVPEEVEKPPSPVPAAPAPVNTYNPTTTSFSGANKCYICEKTVYKTEEMIAVGKVWHTTCFTCGGSNKDGCNRTLKRDGYVDHDSQPYCNACYNKQFRTKGFGVGTNLNTDYGVPPEPVKLPEPVQAPAPPTPESRGTASSNFTPGGFQGVGSVVKTSPMNTSAPVPATPEPSSASANYTPGGFQGVGSVAKSPASSATSSASKPAYTPTNNVAVTNQTPKCTACAKSVYKVEEIIAVGRVWHQSCFTCGGTKGEGCKKTLKRDQYVDHDNQPFCNACYAKLYKPKGFGYGNTLSTDYGPAAEVTTGVSKLSTQEATPPPPPAAPAAAKPSGSYGGGFQGVGAVAASARSPVAASGPSRSPVAGAAPPAPPAPPAPVAAPAPPASVPEPVARRPSATSGFQGMSAAASAEPVRVEPIRRPSAVEAPAPARRPSTGAVHLEKDNVAPFSEDTISKFKQPAILNSNVPQRRASLNIGGSTSANKDDKLHKEVGYVGDNDEVDESEW